MHWIYQCTKKRLFDFTELFGMITFSIQNSVPFFSLLYNKSNLIFSSTKIPWNRLIWAKRVQYESRNSSIFVFEKITEYLLYTRTESWICKYSKTVVLSVNSFYSSVETLGCNLSRELNTAKTMRWYITVSK